METITNYMEAQAQWQKAWSDWIDAKGGITVERDEVLEGDGTAIINKACFWASLINYKIKVKN